METYSVDDDHSKNSAEHFLFAHDKMEPRVQDDGLACYHAVPSNRDDRD